MSGAGSNPWIVRPRPNARPEVRLFCIPHAGGGPNMFHDWAAVVPAGIEICAISLPGRGRRFAEPPYDRFAPIVEQLTAGLGPLLDRPFALFGHSMGAFLAFETARRLRDEHAIEPLHLFVSGAGAPQLPDLHQFHTLSDERLAAALRRMNGVEPEILENTELMELLLPVLRADFAAVETYVCRDMTPLDCPVIVFGGADDWLVPCDRLEPWRVLTNGESTIDVLAGDHFFLRSARHAAAAGRDRASAPGDGGLNPWNSTACSSFRPSSSWC